MKYGNYYSVTLKESPGKGRGVFAEEIIPSEALVLVEPALIVPDFEELRSHKLFHYPFEIGDSMAISLGVGSLINHSDNPNIKVKRLINEERFEFYALRDIAVGEELTHKYVRELWFSPT